MFDVPVREKLQRNYKIHLPIDEKPWKIGLIIGKSGAGKTTIAKQISQEAYHTGFEWPKNKSVLDGFEENLDLNDIVSALSSVGFSSPPNWLLPFSALSNGQQFRVEMARLLLSEKKLQIIDEFTSVVDRQVAKIGCAAISKAIRKKEKQIIAVSCHDDIVDWLEPDWVYNVSENKFQWVHLRRPKIELEIYKTGREYWDIFKQYHYLNSEINPSAQCFVAFLNNEPIAFSSYIHFPHGKLKNCKKEHRTVVLPDYQGIGLGNKLSEFVGQYCLNNNFIFTSLTGNPAMIHHRAKSKKWVMTRKPSILSKSKRNFKVPVKSNNRLTASFMFVGE